MTYTRYIALIAGFLLILSLNVGAQNIRSLRIGDMLPSNIVNKSLEAHKNINTGDYHDRLLILDFWETSCAACVAAIPKMTALQNKFGARIQIIPVTPEKRSEVIDFLNHNKFTRHLKIRSMVEDKQLMTLFQPRFFPHEVWVLKGKIIGITAGEYVDERNINAVLEGSIPTWPVKNDYYPYYSERPLFTLNEHQVDTSNTKVEYAAISEFREFVNPLSAPAIKRNKSNKTIRAYFYNQGILNAYTTFLYLSRANNKPVKPFDDLLTNQIIWKVLDPNIYQYVPEKAYREDWMRKHAICFESVKADTGQNDKQVYASIVADLDILLGLKVAWEKRNEKIYKVIKTNRFSNHNSKVTVKGAKQNMISVNNYIYELNQTAGSPYVFDATNGASNSVFMEDKSTKNFKMLNTILGPLGFDILEKDSLVDHLVFSELDGGRLVNIDMQNDAIRRKLESTKKSKYTLADSSSFLMKNRTQPGIVVTPSGLQYKVIEEGSGIQASANSKVLVHYEGSLINGNIFDSSYQTGRPAEFQINKTIQGWIEAIPMMKEGAVWDIYIPAKLAYGSHTSAGRIPPYSILIFRIELLKVYTP